MQIAEDIRERERMLRAERQQQRVFGGRSLQLEIELTAEALAQRERPRFVDAAAERRVQDELHAAGFVEEALEDERLLRRDRAQRLTPRSEVRNRLLRSARIQSGLCNQPLERGSSDLGGLGFTAQLPVSAATKIGHGPRELVAPGRRLTKPERESSAVRRARRAHGQCPTRPA